LTNIPAVLGSSHVNGHYIMRLLILCLSYFASGWLGLQIPYAGSQITLIWFPTGIAVASVFVWGFSVWPAIYLGAFLVNLTTSASWQVAAGIAVCNTLAPLLTARCLRLAGFHPAFDRRQDVAVFVVSAGLGMMVSASGGVFSLLWAGLLPESAGSSWLSWWMGDTVGVLLAAPLLLTISWRKIEQLRQIRKELMLWILLACPLAWLAFVNESDNIGRSLPLAFLTLPLLAWAALRFGVVGAAFAGLGFSVLAAWSTAVGHGFFLLPDAHLSLFLLWSYMGATMLTALLITALQAERLYVESELKDREQKLRGLYELSPLGVALTDMQGHFIEFNKAFRDICGYPESELKKLGYWELTPRKYADEETRQIESLQRTGHYGPYEKEYIRRDGSLIPLRLNGLLIGGENGQKYIWSIIEDISDRKTSEEQNRRLSAALEQTDEPVSLTDPDARYVYANPAFCKLFGYELGELVGKHISLLKPQNEIAGPSAGLTTDFALQLGAYEGEVWRRTKDGRNISILLKVSPYRDAQGELMGFIATLTDLTHFRQMESLLHESEKHFRDIIENSPLGTITVSLEGKFIHVNKAFCEIVGYTKEALEDLSFQQITPPEDVHISLENIQRLIDRQTNSYRIEKRYIHAKGHTVYVQLDTSLQRDISGEPQYLISQVKDITELKRAEEAQQRLTRALSLLSQCNTMLIHATDERVLLSGICRLAVESGGFLMAWVGYANDDIEKTVQIFAQSGYEEGYLEKANITWADSERGQGPTGAAIRTGLTCVNQNCLTNPKMAPWRDAAVQRGYQSSIAIPLVINHKTFGALTIYAAEPFAFGGEEVALLESLARNISYGIQTLRTRAEHQAALTLLQKSEHRLEESNRQLRDLTVRREEAREEERKRIARDLHDELGQILTSMRMDIALLRIQFGADNPALVAQIKNILERVDSTIQVVRDVAAKLRPSVLDLGIVAALEWQVAEFARRSETEFNLHIDEQSIVLDDERATAIFRIVQESLTNVNRHADAKEVSISLVKQGDNYVLEIADDGKGFETEKSGRRTFGMVGIRERVLMLGGTVNINSAPGMGTKITVRIPIQKGTRQ
jgi:PAS domain S-box-containing protein